MRLNDSDNSLRPCGSSRGQIWGLGRGFIKCGKKRVDLRNEETKVIER